MPGSLTLKPIEVNITKNLQHIENKHPYYVVALGGTKIRSQEAKVGDPNFEWDEAVLMPNTQERTCILKLKTRRSVLKDKTIGLCKIDLGELTTERVSRWYDILHKNKISGRILIEGSISSDENINSQPVVPASQSMNALEDKRNSLVENQDNARQVASLGNLPSQNPLVNEGHVIVVEKPQIVVSEIPINNEVNLQDSFVEDIPLERTEEEEIHGRINV